MSVAAPSPLTSEEFAAILRQDFAGFAERCFYELNSGESLGWNWHLEVLASRLADVARGKINRLIIALPPRQAKSIFTSIALPAWVLGHGPHKKIICASYGQDLSEDLARKTLQVMSAPWYQYAFPARISAQRRATADFQTTKRGFRRAVSVGGAVTGFGADILIIDDPQKPGEALSDPVRRQANTWFSETLYSRLNDKTKGAIVIVMQRLHIDDLIGHVTKGNEDWEVLELPAIAEKTEIHLAKTAFGRRTFRRVEGEALHPDREPLEVLEKIKRQLGTYLFSAQYQQRPLPREGARINLDWFARFDRAAPPRFERVIQSWDTALKTGELNSYSVCTTWGLAEGRMYLLHVFRERLIFPDLAKTVLRLHAELGADLVLIEDASSGAPLAQILPDLGFHAFKAIKPEGEKSMRMEAHTGMLEFGRVFIPREASWLSHYLDELAAFPNPAHWDQIDSTSQALAWIQSTEREPSIITHYRREYERMRAAVSPDGEEIWVVAPPEGSGVNTHYTADGRITMGDADGAFRLRRGDALPLLGLCPPWRRLG